MTDDDKVFADGFQAALQGAEALIWAIEDDAFIYANASEALQAVIAGLQEMEGNWTKLVSTAHRDKVRMEERAAIVAWLRTQDDPSEKWALQNSHWYAAEIEAGAHLK